MDNNYRHKLWNDSLDQVNSNLVNIHDVLTELEGSENNQGSRQDHLVTLVESPMITTSSTEKNHQQKKSQTSSVATPEPGPTRLANLN